MDFGKTVEDSIQILTRFDIHDAMVLRDLVHGAGFVDFAELLTDHIEHRGIAYARGWSRFYPGHLYHWHEDRVICGGVRGTTNWREPYDAERMADSLCPRCVRKLELRGITPEDTAEDSP